MCIVFFYEYQYQAFPGLIRRIFIILFATASRCEQFEVLIELYIDPGTCQVDPRTFEPGNISSQPWNKNFFRAAHGYYVPRWVPSYNLPLISLKITKFSLNNKLKLTKSKNLI